MHAFKFTRPFALILAIVCVAIAAPTSDGYADSGSGAVVHAVGDVPDSVVVKDAIATHLPAATSTTDEKGGSTLKPDSSQCGSKGEVCFSDGDCCSGHCDILDPRIELVSTPLLIAENGKP